MDEERRKKLLNAIGGIPVPSFRNLGGTIHGMGPSVKVHSAKGKAAGRHVGRSIPETTNEQVVKRRRAARKRKPGTVRAVNRRAK